MNTRGRQLDPITEAAIDWLVRLDSGSASAADHTAFTAWLNADPRHQHAWQTISGLLDQPVAVLKELGADIERTVLSRAVRWHLEDRMIVYENKTVVFV